MIRIVRTSTLTARDEPEGPRVIAAWHDEARRILRASDPASMRPPEGRHLWSARRYRTNGHDIPCACRWRTRLRLLLAGR